MRRMGIGLGVGINRSNYAQGIFSAYQSRVIADGGVTEAGSCVDAVSGLLQTASLLLIPSGYKSGKAYAEIPTNGNGDLTWTRASTALRTNSSGLLESMGSGVPRLSYMYGSCPALLLEPQRTNLFFNSGWTGGGATPTNWLSFITGSTTAVTSIKNTSVTAYRFSGTSQRAFFIYSIPVTSGVTYAISVYVESVTTTGDVGFMLSFVNIAGSATYFRNGVSITGTTTVEAGYTYTMLFVPSATASVDLRIGMGAQGNATTNYVLSMPQMEVGAYSTTFILSPTGASATRIADSFSRNNIYTNGLITSSGGTWFVELRNNVVYTRDFSSRIGFGDTSNLQNNSFFLNPQFGGGRFLIFKSISNSLTQLFTTTTSTIKVAIKWNGSTADVFVNGTKQVSATAFTTTNMEFLLGEGVGVPTFVQQMALYPSPLSDTDCTTLTTL